MSNQSHSELTLVLGGTGKTGSRVLQRLTEQGFKTRSGSRSAEPPFDWEDSTTWPDALRGVSAVYISYQPDLAMPGAIETVQSFSKLAVKSGVQKLALLTGRGEEKAQRAEEVIKSSGADWTILRASWFFQNFSESFLLDAVLSGTVDLPVGNVGEPFIDVEDIADVAVAALTEPGRAGKVYELTGPRLLTFAQAVEEISQKSGHPTNYEQITSEQYAQKMEQYEVPKDLADLVTYLFSTILDGRNSYITDDVKRALGREPRDFTDYVHDTVTAGVWVPPQEAVGS